MSINSEDVVRKVFGKSAKEMLSDITSPPQDHSKSHSANAFCGYAGPEEMKHYYRLMNALTDEEVYQLSEAVGIKFHDGHEEKDPEILTGVIEETDREDFYREYYKLIDARPKKKA